MSDGKKYVRVPRPISSRDISGGDGWQHCRDSEQYRNLSVFSSARLLLLLLRTVPVQCLLFFFFIIIVRYGTRFLPSFFSIFFFFSLFFSNTTRYNNNTFIRSGYRSYLLLSFTRAFRRLYLSASIRAAAVYIKYKIIKKL